MNYKVCWSTLYMFVLLIQPAGGLLCMFVLMKQPAWGDELQGMLVYIVYVCIADTTRRGDDLQGMLVYIVYVCIGDTTRRGR